MIVTVRAAQKPGDLVIQIGPRIERTHDAVIDDTSAINQPVTHGTAVTVRHLHEIHVVHPAAQIGRFKPPWRAADSLHLEHAPDRHHDTSSQATLSRPLTGLECCTGDPGVDQFSDGAIPAGLTGWRRLFGRHPAAIDDRPQVAQGPAQAVILFGEAPLYAAAGFRKAPNPLLWTDMLGARTGKTKREPAEVLMVLPLKGVTWDDSAELDMMGSLI